MYTMYINISNKTPSCTHVSSYVLWRVHHLGPIPWASKGSFVVPSPTHTIEKGLLNIMQHMEVHFHNEHYVEFTMCKATLKSNDGSAEDR